MELKEQFPGIRLHWANPQLYSLGLRTATTPAGNTVRCYDAERSIADLLKRKTEGADAQLVQDAVTGYFKRGDKDLPKLATMCKSLGAREELRVYLEVL